MRNLKSIILIIVFSISDYLVASEIYMSEKHSFLLETVTDGLENRWSIEFAPGGAIFITERPGRLRVFEDGKLSKPVKGLPDIKAKGQGGLLDIALDSNFIENKIIFFSYSAGNLLGIGTEVATAKLVNGELKNLKVLFKALFIN